MTRNRWLVLVLVLAVAGVALVVARRGPARVVVDLGAVTRQARFRSTVTASGEIVATRYADIGSSVMGRIVSLPVAEGERVKAGQVLARIDPVQAQSGALGAAAQVRALEAEQRVAEEQIHGAVSDLAVAEARARDAEQQLSRKRDLYQQSLIAASDFDSARAAAEAATAQVTSVRATIDRAKQTAEAASRRIAQARAQQTSANDILAKTSLVSPIDGIVSRLRVREGEMVVVGIQNQPGTTLMTISDLAGINAEVKVAEADVLRLATGQSAVVTLDALPGKPFPGKVVEIGASALPVTGTAAAAREFKVVVRLDQPDPSLRPGLTCDAEIVISERLNVLTAPLQSVVIRGEKTGVFVLSDGQARFTPITSGAIGGLDIEVSGIAEGAQIIIGPYQVLRGLTDGTPVKASTAGR